MNPFTFSIRTALAAGMVCAGVVLNSRAESLVPLEIKLPDAATLGTPPETLPPGVDPPRDKPYAALMVPPGVSNVALGKKVTCSTNVPSGNLAQITDGDKEPNESDIMWLKRGTPWVQIDLEKPCEIYAIAVWHAYDAMKVYHGVVVQVADDVEFKTHVRTIFNNDRENSDGLGLGTDREYFETKYGKLIEGKGTVARYVRLYSHGSSESGRNEYTEVEVHGRPAK